MRRLVSATAVGLVALGAFAGTSAEPAPYVVDGCGTDSHVLGENVPHPYFEAVDIDTIDFAGSYGAPASTDEAPTLDGFIITFEMCAEYGDVGMGEVIRAVWGTTPEARGAEDCDILRGKAEIIRSDIDAEVRAEYVEICSIQENNNGSTIVSSSDRLRVVLPDDEPRAALSSASSTARSRA